METKIRQVMRNIFQVKCRPDLQPTVLGNRHLVYCGHFEQLWLIDLIPNILQSHGWWIHHSPAVVLTANTNQRRCSEEVVGFFKSISRWNSWCSTEWEPPGSSPERLPALESLLPERGSKSVASNSTEDNSCKTGVRTKLMFCRKSLTCWKLWRRWQKTEICRNQRLHMEPCGRSGTTVQRQRRNQVLWNLVITNFTGP